MFIMVGFSMVFTIVFAIVFTIIFTLVFIIVFTIVLVILTIVFSMVSTIKINPFNMYLSLLSFCIILPSSKALLAPLLNLFPVFYIHWI